LRRLASQPSDTSLRQGTRLKIAIATAGRFHVLDLARELHCLGHEVRFYSFVPRRRALSFGLPGECHVSLLPFVFPLLVWQRLLPKAGRVLREWLFYKALNQAVMLRMEHCDVFIFMSGIYLEAACAARKRFGAKLWLERGSQHILAQDEILAAMKGERPTALTIRRELEGYQIADRIVIPSLHVQDSFRRDPAAYRKLFRNGYGVDIRIFTPAPPQQLLAPMVVLFAGTWSLRKGCDVLAEAVRRADVRLIHVGAIGDCPFPRADERFIHFEPVPQWKLEEFYARASAFVLASREDGFGMVLSQAISAGLPVIATERTGAPDLALIPGLANRISVVPSDDADALAEAIITVRRRLISAGPFRPLETKERESLSWAAYARRYDAELMRDVAVEHKECVPSMS
jgi:glycosyltransferase involved in cell wall biosynthesis